MSKLSSRIQFVIAFALIAQSVFATLGDKKGIDIVVKKQPTGSAFAAKTDVNGTIDILLPEGGTYQISIARLCPPKCPTTPRPRPPILQSSLMVLSPDAILHTQIKRFPTTPETAALAQTMSFEIDQPGRVLLRLTDEDPAFSSDAVTFYNTPRPRPKPIQLLGAGLDAFSWQLTFERDDRAINWNVAFSAPTGRKADRDPDPSIDLTLSAPAPIAPGAYTGRIRVRFTGATTIDDSIPVTLIVPTRNTAPSFELDPAQTAIPASATARFTLTNTSNERRTYSLKAKGRSPIREIPPLTLAAGQTGTWSLTASPAAAGAITEAFDIESCLIAANGTCASPDLTQNALSLTTITPRAGITRGAACTPTTLIPLLKRVPTRATQGLPAQFELDVWDDCGTKPPPPAIHVEVKHPTIKIPPTSATVNGLTANITFRESGAATARFLVRTFGDAQLSAELAYPLLVDPSTAPRVHAVERFGAAIGSPFVIRGEFPLRATINAPEGRDVFELGGVRVTLDGAPVPLASAGPRHITSKAVGTKGANGLISVYTGGGASESHRVSTTAAQPAFLAVLHATGEPATPEAPIQPGEPILIEALGLGDDPSAVRLNNGRTSVETQAITKVCCRADAPGAEYYRIRATAPREMSPRPWQLSVGDASSGSLALPTVTIGNKDVTFETFALDPSTSYDINGVTYDGSLTTVTVPDITFITALPIPPVTSDIAPGVRLVFTGWDVVVDGVTTSNPIPPLAVLPLTIPASTGLEKIIFRTQKYYQLKIVPLGTTACGTAVADVPPDVAIGDYYPEGTVFNLIPQVQGQNCTFSGFAGGGTQLNGSTVTLNAPTTVYVVFEGCYMLQAEALPAGAGTLSVSPSATGNITSCYQPNTQVTLTASENAGYTFREHFLSPGSSSTSKTASITMTEPKTAYAYFCQNIHYTILGPPGATVKVNGQTVTLPYTHEDCPGAPFTIEAPAILSLAVDQRGFFSSWDTGTDTSTDIILNLTMPQEDTAITLVARLEYRVTATINPANSGSVSLSTQSSAVCITINATQWWCPANAILRVQASPNSGYAFSNYSNGLTGSTPLVFTPALTAPLSFTANFSTASQPTHTVNSSPSGLLIETCPGCGQTTPFTFQATQGQGVTFLTRDPQPLNNTWYGFLSWSANPLDANNQTNFSQFIAPAVSTTYTATFRALCSLATSPNTQGGTVVVEPLNTPPPGTPSNCVIPATSVRFTARPNDGLLFEAWSGPLINESNRNLNPLTLTNITGPVTVTATFRTAANPSVTLNTLPASIGAIVGIQGIGAAANEFTTTNAPAGPAILTAVPGPIVFNNVEYAFDSWRQGATAIASGTNGSAGVSISGTSPLTYTAAYKVTGYKVNFISNGCGTPTMTPALTAAGFLPPLTTITAINVTGAFTSGAIATTDPSTGAIANTPLASLTNLNLRLTGPAAITLNCSTAAVNITLNSAPTGANLTLSYGSPGSAPQTSTGTGPRTLSITPRDGAQLSLNAQAQFAIEDTGYSFRNYTPGNITTNPATIATPPTSATTYTANYAPACYVLTVTASPSTGGTVTTSPASGLTGFPANCFAAGSTVTLTASPSTGNTFSEWSGAASGTTATTTVTMSAPRNVTATFGRPTSTQVAINSAPITGVQLRIDSSSVTTPGTVSWANGSNHILNAPPSIDRGTTRYAFVNWSTRESSPTLNISNFTGSPTTITANYIASQYQLCSTQQTVFGNPVSVSMSPAGTPVPGAAGCVWHEAGARVTVTATSTVQAVQSRFSLDGATAITAPTTTINMDAPHNLAITFVLNPATRTDHSYNLTGTGNTRTLKVTVINSGATLLRNVASTFSVDAGHSITGATSVSGVDLAPGASRTFDVTVNKTGTSSNFNFSITTTGTNLLGGTHTDRTGFGTSF